MIIDMKTISYINMLILSLLAACLTGCSNDGDMPVPAETVPEELTLTLNLPEYAEVDLTRADDNAISSLTVLCYSKENALLSSKSFTSGWKSVGDGRFEVTVPVHKQTYSIQLVTNAAVPEGTYDLSALFTTDPDAKVSWGRAELKDLVSKTSGTRVLSMVRQNAKVSVSSEANGFSVARFGVYGTAMKGSVAPAGLSTNPTAPTIASGETYAYNMTSPASHLVDAAGSVPVFETARDASADSARGRIIIEGKYNGKTGYYVVGFRTRSGSGNSETPGAYTYTPVDVLRNHHYKVSVKEVRAEGWPSIEEALKAQPDNRMTVLLTDENDGVTDIVASRDYELGVCSEVTVNCDATLALLTVVSSYQAADASKRIALTDDSQWIKSEETTLPQPTKNSQGAWVYQIPVKLEANGTDADRSGTVTVRSGDLMRTVRITQTLRDWLRDSNRKVTFLMDGTTVTSDFFDWVDHTLHGVSKDSFWQSGVTRDNGLLFPAVPAYNAVYRIPRLSDDSNVEISGAPFVLNTTSSYYQISMQTQTSPGFSDGWFHVTRNGVTINYRLYRRSYLHEMKEAYDTYQLSDKACRGWYYYEVVNVHGIWTLDRNLGATNNRPYISTSDMLKPRDENENPIGGYFVVSKTKSSSLDNPVTVISQLGLSRFVIPTRSDIETMKITLSDVTPSGRERTYVAAMQTQSGSAFGTVYIPHGGYYEAESHKYTTHANLWTRTLVSGNQGFSTTSPEFGYWYQFLDVYKSKVNFSNMRIANGSGGIAPDAYSAYKYMPIRPVWK